MCQSYQSPLIVNELFKSISGEVGGFPQGSECIFVRLAGCNLRCVFCDAKDTQEQKEIDREWTIKKLVEELKSMGPKLVVITGGEPLLQSSLIRFVKLLDYWDFQISIETNGTIFVPFEIVSKATIVMDFKMNYLDKMEDRNFLALMPTDYIKFVISNDITMALALNIHKRLFTQGCEAQFAYSPMLPTITKRGLLAEVQEKSKLILEGLSKTNLTGILNIQLHKLIDQR